MTEWKPITFRRREGPKMRKQDDVKHDLKVVRTYHWKKQAKTRKEQKRTTEQTKTHRVVSASEEEEEPDEGHGSVGGVQLLARD